MRRKPTDVLCGIEYHLSRIADSMEWLMEISDPLLKYEADSIPDGSHKLRVLFTDEEQDIVREKLAALGREYKQRK